MPWDREWEGRAERDVRDRKAAARLDRLHAAMGARGLRSVTISGLPAAS
jgi:hypothetical protein